MILGNEMVFRFYQLRPESLLCIPAGARNISDNVFHLSAYITAVPPADPEFGRTLLLI